MGRSLLQCLPATTPKTPRAHLAAPDAGTGRPFRPPPQQGDGPGPGSGRASRLGRGTLPPGPGPGAQGVPARAVGPRGTSRVGCRNQGPAVGPARQAFHEVTLRRGSPRASQAGDDRSSGRPLVGHPRGRPRRPNPRAAPRPGRELHAPAAGAPTDTPRGHAAVDTCGNPTRAVGNARHPDCHRPSHDEVAPGDRTREARPAQATSFTPRRPNPAPRPAQARPGLHAPPTGASPDKTARSRRRRAPVERPTRVGNARRKGLVTRGARVCARSLSPAPRSRRTLTQCRTAPPKPGSAPPGRRRGQSMSRTGSTPGRAHASAYFVSALGSRARR